MRRAIAAVALALACSWALLHAARVGGPELPSGGTIPLAVPPEWHQKNTGGRDGQGLCVFASMRHTGLMQGNAPFAGLFDYMKKFPGGGYPAKVDKMLDQFCREKGLTKPAYLHCEDGDLDLLRAACKSGRVPGVTYGQSPTGRYGGRRIAHMVSLLYADGDSFVVLDNNYIGANQLEWLSAAEFNRVHRINGPWAIILLDGPVSPAPSND